MLPDTVPIPAPPNPTGSFALAAPAPAPQRPSRARQVELILARITALPTLSAVATKLLRIAADDQAQIDEVARLIEADPALTSRLLSMCRRSDKGLGKNITTVRRAVVMLGLDAVRSAVLSLQVIDAFSNATGVALADDTPPSPAPPPPSAASLPNPSSPANPPPSADAFDRKGFWLHSVSVACAAELIAREHPSFGVAPDEAFTAGLLHDLGKFVLALVLPRAYASVARQAVTTSADIAALERFALGVDHHIVGKRLAEHWSLPHALQDTMWLHGQAPAAVPDLPHARLIRLVTVADALARRLQMGFSGNLAPSRPLEELALQAGLDIEKITGSDTADAAPLSPSLATTATSAPSGRSGVIDRLHESVRRRCEDLGLDQPDTAAGVLDTLAKASQRLARLEQIASDESRAARESGAVLHALRAFHKSAHAGAHVAQVLDRVADSVGTYFHDAATCVLLHEHAPPPPSPDAPTPSPVPVWTLVRVRATGVDRVTPLSPTPDMASLAALLREPTPGALAELLAVVRAHLDPPPSIRSLRILPLTAAYGPATLVIHDRPASAHDSASGSGVAGSVGGSGSGGGGVGGGGLDVLAAAWTAAIVAAAQHDAARALAERVADANRALTDAQEQITQAQSLERLAHVTAGAAHEMNSPLAVISGRAQLIAAKSKDPASVADAQTIVQAAHTLDALITRLHSLAKPGAANIELVSLQDLAREAVAMARAKLAPADVTDPPAPIRVHIQQATTAARTDRALLAQLLAELILNALQSESRTGVELRAAVDPDTDRLVLEVRDTGRGMSPHELAHAFDPFFSSLPAGRRAGLGLPTARRLAAVLASDLALESVPGQGTTARISIPDWRPTPRAHDAQNPSSSASPSPPAAAAADSSAPHIPGSSTAAPQHPPLPRVA